MNISTAVAVKNKITIKLKDDGIVGRGLQDHSSLNPGVMVHLELQARDRAGENEMDAFLAVGNNKQLLSKSEYLHECG